MALGLFITFAALDDRRAFVRSNALSVSGRQLMLAGMAGGALTLLLGATVFLIVRPRATKLHSLSRIADTLLPLAWLWPLPLFLDYRVFEGTGLLRVALASLWGLGLERALRASFVALNLKGSDRGPWRMGRFLPPLLLLLLCGWFISFCGRYTVLEHRRFGTNGFDLGLFDNLMFNLSHGEWFHATVDAGNLNGGNHLQYHANFLAYLFVPAYSIHPGSEVLLWIQAAMVGLSAIPFYLLAARRLKNPWFGLAFAYLFIVHEGTQSPVFFEFHFLTLSPFFLGWTLYFFDRGSKVPLIIVWILALLLREDQGTVLAGAALVCLMRGQRPLWAAIGGIAGITWLALMRFVVMPANGPPGGFHQHSGIFQAMIAPGSHGFGGVLKTLLTNPTYALENFLEGRKLEYVLAIAAPFLLLPLRRRLFWILFVPASLFTLVTTNYVPSVSTRFQYTMYWIPMMCFGTLLILSDWSELASTRHRVGAALVSMLVVATALSCDGGGLFQRHTLVGGFRRIGFEMSPDEVARYEELREVARSIPKEASVTATESTVPHVSTRRNIRTLRQGAGDSEYLLVRKDEARSGEQATALLAAYRSERWGLLTATKHFQLWRQGADTKPNRAAMRALGQRVD